MLGIKKKLFTIDDIVLLVNLFYLPHSNGPLSTEILEKIRRVLAIKGSHYEYQRKLVDDVKNYLSQIINIFDKITYITDRDLLYSLYSYLWDMKEEAQLIKGYIEHMESDEKRHKPALSPFHVKGTYRGGFLSALQSLLHFKEDGSFISTTSDNSGFSIEPYRPEFEDGAYEVCLKTANHGDDGTHLFPNDPKLIGERFVGPYIHLQPDLAFILSDSKGVVCGYVLGALDSVEFYNNMLNLWYPKLREKYPKPQHSHPFDEWSDIDKMKYSFHDPKILIHTFLDQYPSHLHIDLVERAQGTGLGTAMITRLLRELKSKGSKGVHLEMSSINYRALKFYKKFGFFELFRYNDNNEPVKKEDLDKEHSLVLGKTF